MKVKIPQFTANYQVWGDLDRVVPEPSLLLDKINFILNAATCASSSHNTQPWSFKIEGSAVWIQPDLLRRLTASDPKDRELYLSLGACLANFEVAARHLKLTPNIKDVSSQGVKINLTPSKSAPKIDLFPAIAKRVNYDGPHQPKPLPTEVLADLQKVFAGQTGTHLKLISDQANKDAIGQLVDLGDQSIFTNPEFIEELVTWLGDSATMRKDGIPTSALGLPPHLRRMACQFMLSLKPEQISGMASQDRQKISATPAIGVIYSENDTPVSWISAGKLYQLAALTAATHDVYLGAQAVLIETGNLHQDLAKTLDISPSRPLMMFRAGFPTEKILYHTPRYPASERLAPAPPANRPTIFQLNQKLSLAKLLSQLGEVRVESLGYTEHYLPDLFSVKYPKLDPRTPEYAAKLQEFIQERSSDSSGVWAYYPNTRKLVHLPDEDDFYSIITANNARIISETAQKKMRQLRFGIAGLSGSGTEAALAIVMSGAKYVRLADHDYLSVRNKGRVTGQTGENKAWNLSWRLWEQNPFLDLDLYPQGVTRHNVKKFVQGLDLILEQTDSASKFLIRESTSGIVAQVTDLENPAVELERDKKPIFGGRAEAENITAQTMGQIGSIAESTLYIAHLIGPDNLAASNYENFSDILEGKANAYSQTFIAVQSGGGAVGRVVVAFAEGKLAELPDSWLVRTLPELPQESVRKQKAKAAFFSAYSSKFPSKR